MNSSSSDQPNEAARIEAIVLADAPMADRVGAALAAAGARVTRVTASGLRRGLRAIEGIATATTKL